MKLPQFPPAYSTNYHVRFENDCNLRKICDELTNKDVVLSLKPKLLKVDICLNFEPKIVNIRLFPGSMTVLSCKNLDEVNSIINKFSNVLNIKFDISEIKEAIVIHKYQIPFLIDVNKFSGDGFTTHFMKIIKLNDAINKNLCATFLINGKNITQTSKNSTTALESFLKFMNKIGIENNQ